MSGDIKDTVRTRYGEAPLRAKRVIFACVHNAGRSQMAAAFFSLLADPSRRKQFQPRERHLAIVCVPKSYRDRRTRIDLSAKHPQRLTDALSRNASLLVTMGCGEARVRTSPAWSERTGRCPIPRAALLPTWPDPR